MARVKYKGEHIFVSRDRHDAKEERRIYAALWASCDAVILTDGTFIDEGYNPYDDAWEKNYRPGPFDSGGYGDPADYD